ncbi:hypothetical protein [Cellulophaga sp. BC115SP]|uniref:hypothetical protein n=1 Tax=Cellulophaga sp. BC115SP TaxID=2683263 RepID=UPI0014127393|nr:hypothetical protein [Cellulophaga sp. BC115SP]NBB32086.1 hypothetical protein [Cellulophaga sp. BC115SP]
MISKQDLINLYTERIEDAQVLYDGGRYNGSYYLCGYAVEIALKYSICSVLNWDGFPSTSREFESKKSLKTHSLDDLLAFTGKEILVKSTHMADWSVVNNWNPENRYSSTVIDASTAELMIESAKKLIAIL